MTPRQVQALIAAGALVAIALVVLVVAVVVGWEDPAAAPASLPTSTSASQPTSTTSFSSTTTSVSPTTTSSSTSTSTPTATSTSTSTGTGPTSTTLPPGACTGPGSGPIPDGVIVVAEVMGDFDGSGAHDDRFMLITSPSGGTWPRLELSYGYSVTQPTFTPRAWAGDARAASLGGPADLAIVQIVFDFGRGAYVWAFSECELRLLREPESYSMGFALTDGPGEKRGLRCLENGIAVLQATSEDGITWWTGGYTLLWDPATVGLQRSPWFTAVVSLHSPEDDALIRSYADFDC